MMELSLRARLLAPAFALGAIIPAIAPAQAGPPRPVSALHHIVMRTAEHKYELLTGSGAGPLMWSGGAVQKSPKIYITYWGWTGDAAGVKAYLNAFMRGIGGSSWANIQTQYHDAGGNITNPTDQLNGTWDDNSSTPPVTIPDSEIAAAAVRAVNHFGYDPNAQYIVATPSGHATAGFATSTGYCAWHDHVIDNGRDIAYTNLPYMPDGGAGCGQGWANSPGLLDGVSIVAGHEYAETVTDPFPNTGWTDIATQENGDKCAWVTVGSGKIQNITLSTGKFAVQGMYSNASLAGVGTCVVSYP